jgi:SH3 domain-containing YSC84-like protein 1
MMRKIPMLLTAVALTIGAVPRTVAALDAKDLKVLNEAPAVLEAQTSAPDKGIPDELLERSECVLVFPTVTKAAFIVGGKYGRGVATCRNASGKMGAPAFFKIEGGSVGWQFGVDQTDLVLLVMNKDGIKHLLADRFTLGGEATAAAGPIGRSAHAATDAQLRAQILSWSRARGLFVGASIEGAIVHADKAADARLYGGETEARDVLVAAERSVPPPGRKFVTVASDLTSSQKTVAEKK